MTVVGEKCKHSPKLWWRRQIMWIYSHTQNRKGGRGVRGEGWGRGHFMQPWQLTLLSSVLQHMQKNQTSKSWIWRKPVSMRTREENIRDMSEFTEMSKKLRLEKMSRLKWPLCFFPSPLKLEQEAEEKEEKWRLLGGSRLISWRVKTQFVHYDRHLQAVMSPAWRAPPSTTYQRLMVRHRHIITRWFWILYIYFQRTSCFISSLCVAENTLTLGCDWPISPSAFSQWDTWLDHRKQQ